MVKLFGILNVTPDSFSDGGQFLSLEKALEQADKLIHDGADFIDVGGESTRPKATALDHAQEWDRIQTVVEALVQKYPGQISLDTRHHPTAEKFVRLGGTIINDVSGFQISEMCEVAAQYESVCIVNHFPGATPEEVHEQNISSMAQVRDDLLMRKAFMVRLGARPENIILDPGIGFGKTMELNHQLLRFAQMVPDEKVMIGHSRKRFLGEHRFDPAPNIKAAKEAMACGSAYLRVHDPDIYQGLVV